jgi:energy-converting hydrogenase B subunit D
VSVVQAVALIAVAATGGAVALVSDPVRQTLLLGVYGLTLTMLFFSFQAPDVALSEIVVSTLGLPVIVFAALRKIRQQESRRQEHEDEPQ